MRFFIHLSAIGSEEVVYTKKYFRTNITAKTQRVGLSLFQFLHNTLITTYEITTADGIANIIDEVKQRTNALNYALIIGGHGTGWTFNEDWQSYPYKMISAGAVATQAMPSYQRTR